MNLKTIKFKKAYHSLIWDEDKTTTIRLTDKNIKVGDIIKPVFLDFDGEECEMSPPFNLLITRVIQTKVKFLNELDAEKEDCKDIMSLLNELQGIYKDLRLDDTIYIFEFDIV